MTITHLNLYARFFLLFTITTILLVGFIILGSFAISEKEAVKIVSDREAALQVMMQELVKGPVDIEALTKEAKKNRVEIQIIYGTEKWLTGSLLPSPEKLTKDAIIIGELYFKKLDSRYFLTTEFGGYTITVTSKIANLIVFPDWIIYWPWFAVLVVLLLSYWLLNGQLSAINSAIYSATEISHGNLKYRIASHPSNDLGKLTRGLNKMAESLEQLFCAKTELLLSVSHELRSPMARVKVLLALLEKGEISRKLGHEIDKMNEIVEQLLESERLKDTETLLNIDTYFLPNVISAILHSYFKETSVRVEGHIPEIAVQIDLGRFKFLVKNLIDNALKHSGSDAPVIIQCFEENQIVEISVRDFGAGIEAENLEKIFEPFAQGSHIINRSNKGVGLGLYLCRQIARAHGGDISVKSVVGKGSEFSARMPINKSVK
ncbi:MULTISPECIES: HAMP domain-containing sensor histidine kinase [Pseudoalteromonas]|uniref:histidine kinase n=1 Tax=Pseudoalteromonas amylolytica TaxID=1859457 RepID=A0A1S1MQ89_9GAMM|nr:MULTISPECIES: HAMP domain-containing sensor histidine kinase [Pseudoalteromonas]OHU85690.1 hypothetical protein BFC16_17355 [Pseudoalteromonas sp. JW3]OHU87407.1 hypothetical protein BET10_21025 [Pseudoalteromonas amylolytica]